jgi:uncharacterized cupredoxin-like copper-binding protein
MSCTLYCPFTPLSSGCGGRKHRGQVGAVVLVVLSFLVPSAFHAMAPENTVEVTLSEYKIEMPSNLPAGVTVFKVMNSGSKKHDFKIEGNGIEKKLKSSLKKGESGTMQVDLKPGTYKVTCPVMGHTDKGMSLELNVK